MRTETEEEERERKIDEALARARASLPAGPEHASLRPDRTPLPEKDVYRPHAIDHKYPDGKRRGEDKGSV
ncbi:MAG TPA: hypothetical protein VHD55_00420 [Candidatus Paceibacterota bacterium]|nr:hypothetical protein [Candidatus Paceibacterota bacterium]